MFLRFLTMFKNASSFNQTIGDWNISSATHMTDMFTSASALSDTNKGLIHASSFNQDMTGKFVDWNTSNVNQHATHIQWLEYSFNYDMDELILMRIWKLGCFFMTSMFDMFQFPLRTIILECFICKNDEWDVFLRNFIQSTNRIGMYRLVGMFSIPPLSIKDIVAWYPFAYV